MNSKIIYIELAKAIELHDWIIDRTVGDRKATDDNCLKNVFEEIKNNSKYPEFKDKLISLVFAINESQNSIEDSNRLSILLGCYFLELNGYDYVVNYFSTKMENIVVWLSERRISKNLLAEIIE